MSLTERYRLACAGTWVGYLVVFGLLTTTASAQSAFTTPPAADPVATRDAAWSKVRTAMTASLDRLENFSCIQNITRRIETRGSGSRKPKVEVDQVRLQVTNSAGQESFSFPGDIASVSSPEQLIPTGLSGTGAFLGYARSVFVKQPFSQLRLAGEETYQGSPALRFTFVFDSLRERLNISRPGGAGSVGAQGEVLVDPDTGLARWLRITSSQSLPEVGVEAASYEIQWSPLHGPRGTLLIPERASMTMTLFSGEQQRNDIVLSQCLEFQTESELRFDDAPETSTDSSADNTAQREAARIASLRSQAQYLPPGLSLQLTLDQQLDLPNAVVGEPFTATLSKPASTATDTILPAGATVHGRVRRISFVESPEPHTVVWLELNTIRDGDRVFLALAQLQQHDPLHKLVNVVSVQSRGRRQDFGNIAGYSQSISREELVYPDIPGVATLVFLNRPAVLPKGYRTTWISLAPTLEKSR